MPSGYTHMILTKLATEGLTKKNLDLQELLQEHQKYLRLGSVAPDIAYSQEIKGPLSNETEIADVLHYNQTNQIPLRALKEIKKIDNITEKETAFAFFTGYITHIVADGIIHPFVRDKVGDYNIGNNAKEHRILEMKLDVLFLNHLSGLELNYTNIHDGMLSPLEVSFDHISSLFSELINEIYYKLISMKEIEVWIKGLHLLFSCAESNNNGFYSKLAMFKNFLFPQLQDLIEKQNNYLVLKIDEHKGADKNFANKEIHFINDCIPQFQQTILPIIIKSYNFVFQDMPEVTESDIPAINLDTGRELKILSSYTKIRKGEKLEEEVIFWKG